MTKKIFALIIMMTAFSFFVSCNAGGTEDSENKPDPVKLSERVGTYKGTESVSGTAVKIVFTAEADGTGNMAVTIDTDPPTNIPMEKTDMDSTKSSHTESGITIAFDSATDKDSNITMTMPTGIPNPATITLTLVKQ